MGRPALYDAATSSGSTDNTVGIEDLVEGFIGYFPAAAVAKKVVVVDTSDTTYGLGKSFKTATAASAAQLTAVGVLRESVAAGGFGFIQTRGPMTDVLTGGSVAAGDALTPDTSGTAGALVTATVGTHRTVGFALETDDATPDADVFLQF